MLAKSTTLCKLLPRDCGYSDQAESAASKFRTRQPLDANNHTNTSRSSVTTEKSKYHAGTRQLQQITWNTHTHTHIQQSTHHEMGGPMHTPDQQPRRLVKEEQSRRSAHCSQYGMALMCS